jgi:hypothetical protein
MTMVRTLLCLAAFAALSGCVVGYGRCLFLQPFKHDFSGVVHFHDYPAGDGIDNVAILALDTTAYVYAPAQSSRCLPANDVQMVGLAEFPRDVGENSHVSVNGSLYEATTSRQHTAFLLNVNTILPFDARERSATPAPTPAN